MPIWGKQRAARKRAGSGDPFALSRPLLHLSKVDPWTIGDACEGTQVFGATGSGKTSGSGQAIAKAMLSAGFGGLVLTAKPDERALWERYCAETGRSGSLLVFGADTPHRFNFLDYERARGGGGGDGGGGGGLTENLVALFTTVLEAAEGGSTPTNDPFWPRALRQLLRNTIDAISMAGRPIELPGMAAFIASAPQSLQDVGDPAWMARSLCWQVLTEAQAKVSSDRELHDLEVTARYWCEEFPALAERTRSSIVATFTTMADGLIRGHLRELFCTSTNVIPELTHEGVILVIDLPVKTYHEVGRFAQILWKYCWQRATESRDTNANPRPVFLWADEAQLFITEKDPDFQATARSARACTVYLTQNLPNYLKAIGGHNAKASTDAFLGVLQTKVFHANGDAETNEWAERVVAKKWINKSSTSSQEKPRDKNEPDPAFPERSFNTSSSPSLNNELLAREFTLLRKGGQANNLLVDAIVVQGGRVWKASGTNYLRTTFRQ